MANTTNSRVIKECKSRPWWKKVYEVVADPARADLIQEWLDLGVDIVQAVNDIEPGIEATRDALAPILGKPKIYIHPICRHWRREVDQYYEKNGKPVDADNHTMDETRYFVMRNVRANVGPRIRSLR